MNTSKLLDPFAPRFFEGEYKSAVRGRSHIHPTKSLSKNLDDYFHKSLPEIFLETGVHVCSARGRWDLPALLEQEVEAGGFEIKRSKTAQSIKPTTEGTLIYELFLENKEQTYIHVVEDDGYDLSVISASHDHAAGLLESLRAKFLPLPKRPKKKKEAFFRLINLTRVGVETKRIKLRRKCRLSGSKLALHYGEQFADWEQSYVELLGEGSQGLTILRGDPGTGKTFFIRHLIARLKETHRFYLINLTDFNLLTSPSMVEFWSNDLGRFETRSKKKLKRVIIIEDAERLLSTRTKGEAGSVSELLNMCDGLLGDFLKVHLICTANCPLDDFDPAVVRSGRLTAMKEFLPLDFAQAWPLAEKLGVELEEGRDYTLADIYNRKPSGAEGLKEAPKIGFMECPTA